MAKQARAFQMPSEDLADLGTPEEARRTSKPVEHAPDRSEIPASPGVRPAYRQDRKNLSVWLDRKAFNAFKAMIAEEGETMQDYVVDMINREFARKGRPQIAKK